MLIANLKPSNHANQALLKSDLIPTFLHPKKLVKKLHLPQIGPGFALRLQSQ